MESIGQKLISARESLGYSIEQIARETNIAKSYLIALEAEDFDCFPGETYLLGFLRNYSEFLGIDSQEMISLYRNMVIQEQPVPMEELLEKKKSISPFLIIIIAVLGLVAVFYFWIYPDFIMSGEPGEGADREQSVKIDEKPRREVAVKSTYEFSDEVVEKRFRKGDSIAVAVNEERFNLVIDEIKDSVLFVHPGGELAMAAGEEKLLDLDEDDSPDIRILLRSFDADTESAVIHIDRFVQISAEQQNEGLVNNVAARASDNVSFGEAGAQSRVIDPVVIRSADRPEPFSMNVVFRGYCLLRYFLDNSVREERYFHKGETFRLEADSEIRLWVSNAGSFSGKINGIDLTLGGSGEISTRSIKWIYNDTTSKYELQVIPVY